MNPGIRRMALLVLVLLCGAGCQGPGDRLSFPENPTTQTPDRRSYDVSGDGRIDFALDAIDGRFGMLRYDDDEDGEFDRAYRLGDYDPARAPHLIVLIDSIPFEPTLQRYHDAAWTWFDEPVKVIPPFPSMSGVIFTRLLGAPPTMGAINQYYDRGDEQHVNRIWERLMGSSNPWERRLHYRLGYFGNGNSFLKPRSWFAAELAMAKEAFDKSPDRVTVVYLASAAGMLSQFGEQGLSECLDGIERLTLQVLHERQGAVKVSVVSDHGHNLRPGIRIDVASMLEDAGFRPGDKLRNDRDVVLELDGLINYFGLHCRMAAEVAAALIARPEITLVTWLEDDHVMVGSKEGTAAIEFRQGKLRYNPINADVLGFEDTLKAMWQAGVLDADGFATPENWLKFTADHHWPDAPTRLWEAFHGLVVNTPNVMAVPAPGYYAGDASFEKWIDMASTHGGLDQADSAAVLLTMTGRASAPLRTRDVMRTIEPEYDPAILRRK